MLCFDFYFCCLSSKEKNSTVKFKKSNVFIMCECPFCVKENPPNYYENVLNG